MVGAGVAFGFNGVSLVLVLVLVLVFCWVWFWHWAWFSAVLGPNVVVLVFFVVFGLGVCAGLVFVWALKVVSVI